MKGNGSLEVAYWHMGQKSLPEACKSSKKLFKQTVQFYLNPLFQRVKLIPTVQFNSTNSMGENADRSVKSPN